MFCTVDARSNNSAYYGVGPSNRLTAIPAPNAAAVAHRRSRSLRRRAAGSSVNSQREHSAHALDCGRSGPQLASIELDVHRESGREDAEYEDLETLERQASTARALIGQSATSFNSIKRCPPPPAVAHSRPGASSNLATTGSLRRAPPTGLSSHLSAPHASTPASKQTRQLSDEPYSREGVLQTLHITLIHCSFCSHYSCNSLYYSIVDFVRVLLMSSNQQYLADSANFFNCE